MAVQVDDIILVEVTQIEAYGVWVEAEGERGLINIPEMTWGRVRHPSDIVSLGDIVQVKVLHLNPSGGFSASLRAAHPELNPWRDPSLFSVGETFIGPIIDVRPYGCFVEIAPNVRAVLLRTEWQGEYSIGQTISVRVISVDMERQRVTLAPEISETGHHVWD